MRRFRHALSALALVLVATLGGGTASATPPEADSVTLELLTQAIEALQADDMAAYDAAAVDLSGGDHWLPTLLRRALRDQDEERLVLMWLALNADEVELLRLTMDTLGIERDAYLYGTVDDPESGRAVRRSDEDNDAMRQILDRRGIELPDSVQTLMELNQPATGTKPPRPALFDDAIGEIAAVIAGPGVDGTVATAAGTSATEDDDGSRDPTTILLVAFGVVGAASLLFAVHRGRKHDQMADYAYTDSLTGLGNRRRFDADVEVVSRRGLESTAMLMVDVDHFKRFNDTHGHAVGDEVLRLVADTLSRTLRQDDIAYRYGGEEFCVLLGATTPDDAFTTGERLRAAISRIELPVSDTITASVGVSIGPAERVDQTIDSADSALYAAKSGGRNRVAVA